MANKTITVSTDISSLIATGLNSGENIDINGGATLTVDVSPSVLIGQIKINVGKMIVDGANATNPIIFCGEKAEEINVNGAGILETTLGWYTFTGTSDGTATYSLDVSNYFSDDPNNNIDSDIFTGLWVETGRRIDYDNDSGVAPQVGDWLFKATDNDVMGRVYEVGIGYLVVEDLTGSLSDNDVIELHTIQDNNGPDYQKSWTANVNNVYGDILELDVWTKWANTFQNNADRMSLIGNGNDGRVFLNVHGSNTVTFGNGTTGRIPPNGCRFKIPMVHFCTSTVALFNTNDTSPEAGTGNPYNVELNLGGDVILRGASLGTAVFGDSGAASWLAESCCTSIVFGSSICGSKVVMTDVMVIGSLFSSTSSPKKYVFETYDLVNGAELTNCAVYILHPNSTETGHIGGVTSNNLIYKKCIQVTGTSDEESYFYTIKGITLYDIEIYGAGLSLRTCSDVDAKLLKFQAVVGTVARSSRSMVSMVNGTNGVFISGIEILKGSATTNYIFNIGDTSNVKIRGLHFSDAPVDLGGIGQVFFRTTGISSNIDIARCHRTNSNVNEVYTGTPVSSNISLVDCTNDYDGEIEPKGTDVRMINVGGGSGNLGNTTGVETDYTGSFGSNSAQIIRSDTTGAIALMFMPPSPRFPFIDITGNPLFTKDGDFDGVNGDSFTIVTDKYYGIQSFTGVYTASRSSGSISDGTDEWGSRLTMELQYDDGTGYNGTWLDVKTPSDLTGIPNLETGAIFKIRISFTGSRTNLNGLLLHFNTTVQSRKDNITPIDQFEVDFVVTDLQIGSIVEIYDNEISDLGNNNTKLAFTNNSSNSFTYTHNGTTNDIRVQVIKKGYVERIEDFTLIATDQSLGMSQILDNND